MRIRSKILLLVLPLIVSPLIILGTAASLSARNGITSLATEFLQFKSEEIRKYATTQWALLEESALTSDVQFVEIAQDAVRSYALSLVGGETDVVFALDGDGDLVMATSAGFVVEDFPKDFLTDGTGQWVEFSSSGEPRVGQAFYFEDFGWTFVVSETRDVFYAAVNNIFRESSVILIMSLVVTALFVIYFTRFLTRPLGLIVQAMRDIISSNDLGRKVPLTYNDEIGELGHTFNIMTDELGKAYEQVKNYAYQAALSEQNEKKIRRIFQKYVPQSVIEEFYNKPEAMLTGDSRVLAVLFSDIRDFTSISEGMVPETIVESLNRYFGIMVERIMERGGVVDKYIGDAIMAFFGAPVKHENDALRAVEAGLDMNDGLEDFNNWQSAQGRRRFEIGIGVNYGVVTVGNIGSDRKMDYTVIGESVNLASRLEGLTKKYQERFVISESVYRKIKDVYPCRLLDIVRVKGMERGVKVYGVRRTIDAQTAAGWRSYHKALSLYYSRDFAGALEHLGKARTQIDGDPSVSRFSLLAQGLVDSPPPEDWNGISVMDSK